MTIDIKRWVYSQDIANWICENTVLSMTEQIDCICTAPHRTLREKLAELQKMYMNPEIVNGNKIQINDIITHIETILHTNNGDMAGQKIIYNMNIYYRGQSEIFLTDMFFCTKEAAIAVFLEYIEESVRQKEDTGKLYYAAIDVLALKTATSQRYQCVEQLIVRHDGEIICSSETVDDDFHYLKLPYQSGTILTSVETPFLPSIKGVLVNYAEPGENGFAENIYNQWLICPQMRAQEVTNGIDVINLTDYYNPFSDEGNYIIPYKQLLTAYQVELGKQEQWLMELSQMVQDDKTVVDKILHDRQPKPTIDLSKRRLAYVRTLN